MNNPSPVPTPRAPFILRMVRYICSRLAVTLGATTFFSFFLSPLSSKEFLVLGESRMVGLRVLEPLILAPLFETLVLLIGFAALSRIDRWIKSPHKRDWVFALLLGLFFTFLHGVADSPQGVIMIVPGIVFSKAIIDWSGWHSRALGYLVSAGIHALHNTVAVVILLWL